MNRQGSHKLPFLLVKITTWLAIFTNKPFFNFPEKFHLSVKQQ